jgi:hypothetical protein
MASVNYETIFNLFLGNITDYKLASLDEKDAKAIMKELLHKTLAASYLSRIFSSSSFDDTAETFTYEMAYDTTNDETDFVCTAIAKWMVYEWLHNQVNSVINTAQFFGGAEQKYYSQQAHLAELRNLEDSTYTEARRFVMDRGWIKNSYLGGS